MKRTTQRLTANQIEKIYWAKVDDKKSYKEIAWDLDIDYNSVSVALRTLRSYFDPTLLSQKQRKFHSYLKAVRDIKQETARRGEEAHKAVGKFASATEEINEDVDVSRCELEDPELSDPMSEDVEIEDRFSALDKALAAFQEAVSEFIGEEVDSQVGKIKDENEVLRKKIEDLEPLKEAARKSNFVGSLRRKFGAERVKSEEW